MSKRPIPTKEQRNEGIETLKFYDRWGVDAGMSEELIDIGLGLAAVIDELEGELIKLKIQYEELKESFKTTEELNGDPWGL